MKAPNTLAVDLFAKLPNDGTGAAAPEPNVDPNADPNAGAEGEEDPNEGVDPIIGPNTGACPDESPKPPTRDPAPGAAPNPKSGVLPSARAPNGCGLIVAPNEAPDVALLMTLLLPNKLLSEPDDG